MTDTKQEPSPTVERDQLVDAVIAMRLWPDYDADNVPQEFLDIAQRWRDVWKFERPKPSPTVEPFLQLHASSTELYRHQGKQEPSPTVELEAFEAWWGCKHDSESPEGDAAWRAWQARAAAPALAPSPTVEKIMRLVVGSTTDSVRAAVKRLVQERDRLAAEVEILRRYGNKDCTAMADAAMKETT